MVFIQMLKPLGSILNRKKKPVDSMKCIRDKRFHCEINRFPFCVSCTGGLKRNVRAFGYGCMPKDREKQ